MTMCDDLTEKDNQGFLARRGPNRREAMGAGVLAAAALTTGCGPGSANRGATSVSAPLPTGTGAPVDVAAANATNARRVEISTADGVAEGYFVAPKTGKHPGVLIWPDVAGLRSAFEIMATELASAGYAVLAINPYYRSSRLPILTEFSQWRSDEGKAKIAPMREMLTADRIAQDGAAFCRWLDQQGEVAQDRKLGTSGYCMGGPFTFRTAAAYPERVGAIASFHGGGLATEDADSPHRLLPKMGAAALVCIAANDHERDQAAKSTLEEAAKAAKLPLEIEVYPAQHGWCVIDSPVYDEVEAGRAWARLLAVFGEHL